MAEVRLISPLSPDECLARVRAATSPESLLGIPLGARPVLARISGRALTIRKQLWPGNSFQTVLSGTFEPHPEGTRFAGDSGIHVLVAVSVTLGGIVWIFVWTMIFASAVADGPWNRKPLPVIVPPLAIVGFFGVVAIGRLLAWGEGEFLTQFLTKLLDARAEVVPPSPEPSGTPR